METIEFLICTINDGIENIPQMLLPPTAGVCYLISWQQTEEWAVNGAAKEIGRRIASRLEERADVRVSPLVGKGLSKNRNHALSQAIGDLLVISDDDCRYDTQSINTIRQAFKTYPESTVIQFQGINADGHPIRPYSTVPYDYEHRPYGAYVCSWELVVRNQKNLPRFDERFGIGAPLGCGEEEIFVHQIAKQKLEVRYVPTVLVQTDGNTTGDHFWEIPSLQRAKGGVLAIMHGPLSAMLRCLKFTFTAQGVPFHHKCKCFIQTVKGIVYVYRHHSLS